MKCDGEHKEAMNESKEENRNEMCVGTTRYCRIETQRMQIGKNLFIFSLRTQKKGKSEHKRRIILYSFQYRNDFWICKNS